MYGDRLFSSFMASVSLIGSFKIEQGGLQHIWDYI